MLKNGCLKPCYYKEYVLDTKEKCQVIRNRTIEIVFSNSDLVIEKELESYSMLSLLSDIGGAPGMFLGFSFLMVWDTVLRVGNRILSCFWHKCSQMFLVCFYLCIEQLDEQLDKLPY